MFSLNEIFSIKIPVLRGPVPGKMYFVCGFLKIEFYRDSREVLYIIEELMKCSFQINI